MRYWILLYYLLFIFNVSYRDFSFEYKLYSNALGYYDETVYWLLYFAQILLIVLAAAITIFTEKKLLHLLFFGILFSVDLYVQNVVKFESYAILIHLTPLFIYLILQINNRKIIHYLIAAYLCIGFTVSGIGKINGGWLSLSDRIIYTYYNQFNSYSPNMLIPSDFVHAHFYPDLWKSWDYVVIFFQLSAVLLLFSKRYMKHFLLLEVFFHLGVAALLQISLFYPYIIFYGMVICCEAGESSNMIPARTTYLYKSSAVVLTLVIAYIYHSAIVTDLTFVIFKYKDFVLTVGCALLFLFYWAKYALRGKYVKT